MNRRVRFAWAGCAVMVTASAVHAETAAGIYGAWDLTVGRGDNTIPSWVKLHKDGGETVVDFVGRVGGQNRATDVKVDANRFQWKRGNETYHATLTGHSLEGYVVDLDGRRPFVGERVVRAIDVRGMWDITVETTDQTYRHVLTFAPGDSRLTGTYKREDRAARKLTSAKRTGDRVTFTIDYETNDGDVVEVRFDVKVRGDRFAGGVEVVDGDFEADVTGVRRRRWGRPIRLFNGKDLSNWDFQKVSNGENRWKVIDGEMVNSRPGWNAFTKQKFKDYKLRVDVKVPPRGNSGIYLNGRYEVQVNDSYGRGISKSGMGAIYTRAVPTANPAKPANEWQTFEITFVDYYATVVLNGRKIIDNVLIEGITGGALDSHESQPGPILLQGDHSQITYRNIVLTPLLRP